MSAQIVIPSATKKYEYKVPRSFKLHEELTLADKAEYPRDMKKPPNPHASYFSLGSSYSQHYEMSFDPYNNILDLWNVSLAGGPAGTVYADNFYTMKVRTSASYPDHPPQIYFITKIAMPGVDPNTGVVDMRIIRWNRDMCIMDALCQIRELMKSAPKGMKQPTGEYPLPAGFPRT